MLWLAVFLIPFAMHSQQIADHALGLRLGDSDGFGAEISYQKRLGQFTRMEADLGWRDSREYDAFKLSGNFQWVRHLDGSFNWFYGVGGNIGSVDFEQGITDDDGGLFIAAAGTLGIEYDFEIPLLISFDLRPEIGILGYDGFDDNFDFDIAIGIRYQFQ